MTTTATVLQTLRDLQPQIAQRAAQPGDLDPWTVQALQCTGATRAVLSVADGGEDAGLAGASAILRVLASADASAALVLAMQYIHLGRLRVNPHPAAAELLRHLAGTGGLVNVAASEQLTGAPSDGGVIRSTATRAGDGWTVSGHKRWVTGSTRLERVLVTAVADGTDGAVHTFVVDPTDPAVRIVPSWDSLGLVGTASHDLIFDNAPVLADLGPAVKGQQGAFAVWWSVLLASIHLGLADAARVEALAHAAQDRYDGRPGTLADLVRVQERAGRLELEHHQAEVLLAAALDRHAALDRQGEDTDDGAVGVAQLTKLLVHTHATAVVEHATKLVGGASIRGTSTLSRLFLDLRAAAFSPPREEAVVIATGRRALGLPPEQR